eukprot:CAMPEP_0118674306 /NCGR_PEP_ID=MMETSP0800-20121206/817_1 /TAXON_ID=210618 ORGANISM="Striatella unipunctata, Strain CCMP2910" /NCGR_SAMPLE_ID=MMETSP0800 /ASSEMBLY_ACC=CAM_ASM_000638 /LENGTH=108 /DNA_ID=CAMNT_0006569491 /DNA_START=9 /DNA_END=335 /DNA_ORIENTATION=+
MATLKLIMRVLSWIVLVYVIVIVKRTRAAVRDRYAIPERVCHGCEDVCIAIFCYRCAAAQMARHTVDYERYPAECCTSNGLRSHVNLEHDAAVGDYADEPPVSIATIV